MYSIQFTYTSVIKYLYIILNNIAIIKIESTKGHSSVTFGVKQCIDSALIKHRIYFEVWKQNKIALIYSF